MISVNGFKFEGPITSFDELRDEEGLYAFFIADGEQAEVIRFGHMSKVRSELEAVSHLDPVYEPGNDGLFYGVIYADHMAPEFLADIHASMSDWLFLTTKPKATLQLG